MYNAAMDGKLHLLFDADGTLYDFAETERRALSRLFGEYGIDGGSRPIYEEGNRKCWEMYEDGRISIAFLSTERFRMFFSRLGKDWDPEEAGNRYTRYLGKEGILIPGAEECLQELQGRYSISLITNGIGCVQRDRIRRTDTGKYYSHVFISEDIGYAKPDPRFFSAVLSELGAEKESCIVIGDSLTSDIRGAELSGIDSIYISFSGEASGKATWSVSSYSALLDLLL